jgi:hypothetical protein
MEQAVTAKVPGRTPMPSERRLNARRRVLKGGNMYFNSGYGAFSCTVKNLSESGALVMMEDTSGLPGVFDFRLNGEPASRKAHICWKENGKAGLQFS